MYIFCWCIFTSGFVAEDIMAIDKSFVDAVAAGGIVFAELQLWFYHIFVMFLKTKISKHDLKLLILLEEIMAWYCSSALLLLSLDSWLWSPTLQQCMENFLMLLLKKILIFKGAWRHCKEIFWLHGWRQDWCCYERTIAPAVVIFIVPLNYVLLVMMEIADLRRILH